MVSAHYQLIFLGDLTSSACNAIKKRFFSLLDERGLESSLIDIMDGERVVLPIEKSGYNPQKPAFAFYFGNISHRDKDVSAVLKLLNNAKVIYPIYFTDGNFLKEIPSKLHQINGRLYNHEELDSIVNVAFEEFRLLRKRRRVFISYKRSDSVSIANQLYDILSRHQFDVFLDTYSIRGGVEFQKELHHRITDSDVLIQLNTNSFMDSEWCKEEITIANMHQIGILQINWPGIKGGSSNDLCFKKNLLNIDFRRKKYKKNKSLLNKKVLEEITEKVESIRARNLAARYDNLKGEFIKEARRCGRNIISESCYLVEKINNDKYLYYIPTIGVPQSIDCHESSIMLEGLVNGKVDELYLIYDDLSVLSRWIEHLDWMNNFLLVKTIKKQEFKKWFECET